MHDKPQGRGYVKLGIGAHPWPLQNLVTEPLHAHEFHYSSLENLPDGQRFAYQVQRGKGITAREDGLVYKNLLAAYTHMRSTGANPWVRRFLQFVSNHRSSYTADLAGVSST